jgi:hypothetical protein
VLPISIGALLSFVGEVLLCSRQLHFRLGACGEDALPGHVEVVISSRRSHILSQMKPVSTTFWVDVPDEAVGGAEERTVAAGDRGPLVTALEAPLGGSDLVTYALSARRGGLHRDNVLISRAATP